MGKTSLALPLVDGTKKKLAGTNFFQFITRSCNYKNNHTERLFEKMQQFSYLFLFLLCATLKWELIFSAAKPTAESFQEIGLRE